MTSSMSILPTSISASRSVGLEISSVTPIATHVNVTPAESWVKTHRRQLIIVGVVLLTSVLLAASLLFYFLSYKPNHENSDSVDNQKEFELWMNNHGRSYATDAAKAAAYSNWLGNLQAVNAANLENTGVTYRVGPYADLNHTQFQSQILTLSPSSLPPPTTPPPTPDRVIVSNAPASLNWATNPGMVSPVKDQGECGDCWAFAAAEAFEVAYNMAYAPSKSIQLSPQQINSCDTGDGGCNGGNPYYVYTGYLAPNSGHLLTTEANYPYKNGNSGNTLACNTAAAATGFVELTSYTYVVSQEEWTQQAEDQLIAALQTRPVSIAVDASPWDNYGGGVLSNQPGGCTSSQNDVDHAVQVVGYTPSYWIVKNQWGTYWGDKGYIYLARGANTCCILCAANQVTVTSTQSGATTVPPTTLPPTTKAPSTLPPTTKAPATASGSTTTAKATTPSATTKVPTSTTTSTTTTTTTTKATTTTTTTTTTPNLNPQALAWTDVINGAAKNPNGFLIYNVGAAAVLQSVTNANSLSFAALSSSVNNDAHSFFQPQAVSCTGNSNGDTCTNVAASTSGAWFVFSAYSGANSCSGGLSRVNIWGGIQASAVGGTVQLYCSSEAVAQTNEAWIVIQIDSNTFHLQDPLWVNGAPVCVSVSGASATSMSLQPCDNSDNKQLFQFYGTKP